MRTLLRCAVIFLPLILIGSFSSLACGAQTGTTSGTITGTVSDPTGAVLPRATVRIENPVSQYEQSVKTDSAGHFQFANVPYNSYHMTVTMAGFGSFVHDVAVRGTTPVNVPVTMSLGTAATTVQVNSEDLVNSAPTMDTEIDRKAFAEIPLESASSGLSSLVTLSSPGVTADSNGMFHGLGDHAENSFSVDGQPITDQQSKAFSNQLPDTAVQSMQVIEGAPPAEYGDKTSLVIQVTTRSGQGDFKPTGQINYSYGTFGTSTGGFDLGYGKEKWGNFISVDGLNTGRFLDGPEFVILHDKGNEENVFDRVDYQIDAANSLHLNLNYSRSWFQTPNTYDNLNAGGMNLAGAAVTGQTDQRSKIGTVDVSPTYTRVVTQSSVWNLGAYFRKDNYHYYPSGDPLADLGPVQQQSIGQDRSLANEGLHTDLTLCEGSEQHEVRSDVRADAAGRERRAGDRGSGISGFAGLHGGRRAGGGAVHDAGSVRSDAGREFLQLSRAHGCEGAGAVRGGSDHRRATGCSTLGFAAICITGWRTRRQAEPRLGGSYNIKKTNTVLRASYARTMETPFNENLVLASHGCLNAVVNPLLGCQAGDSGALAPGYRNEYHAGLAAGGGAARCGERGVHLEVHEQRLRLQRAGEYADHVSDRVA